MKIFRNLFLSSVLLFSLSVPTFAATNLMTAENLVVTETLFDDAYLMFGNGNIEGDIYGDAYIAGGTVTINGKITEDLVIGGGKVTIMGDVGGDIRIIGGQAGVYSKVGDDLVVLAGQVDVGKTAVINGSLISSAGLVTVDGTIKEDVRGLLGMIILNGRVEKNITVTVEDGLKISDKAVIGGNLTYSALVEATIPAGVVKGAVSFNKFERDSVLQNLTYVYLVEQGITFLGGLLLLLIFVYFAPKALVLAAEKTRENVFKAFGIGLLTMIGALVGSILLMVTIIGIPLALIIFAGLIIILFVTQVFVAVWLSGYVVSYKKMKKGKMFLVAASSLLVYNLVGLIPVAGWALNIVLFLIGVGSMYMMKMEYYNFLKKKDML